MTSYIATLPPWPILILIVIIISFILTYIKIKQEAKQNGMATTRAK